MTKTENIVLATEKYLNSKRFKDRFPETGEDVKVMGFRKDDELELIISMAFIDRFINDEKDYFEKKARVLEDVKKFVEEKSGFEKIDIQLNTLDTPGRGLNGIYLTVLGTSADGADSGQVGRGNRVNGVISLNRPQCSEAAAGKNPVSHVGKIYNLLTHEIAKDIYANVSGIREVYVWMLSKIGRPIDQPVVVAVQIIPENSISFDKIRKEAERIIDYRLEGINEFCMKLAYGKVSIC
ncbi:S-adenosylmethionine synthetase, partial [Candidatus Bathyarchaeota archaeon]|nr:S-adenosylmethionine synthetase [Candidatus Bathyarchaeota archaeon]